MYRHYIFMLCWLPFPVHAIVNVEQAIIGKTEPGLHGSVSLAANGASGNSEKNTLKADAQALWQHDGHTEFAQFQYASGQSRGQTDTDRAFLHLRHRTALDQDWGTEVFAQTGRDRFARLAQRNLLGGGLRWVLQEEVGRAAAYLGFGAFHEQESLNAKFGTTDALQTRLWRANSYLVLKQQLNAQVRFNNTLYYQPALSDGSDYRVLEQAALLVKLADKLDLKVSLEVAFDSRPPQTVQRRDVLYSTGLEYAF
jgi:putative salt-induced outer membrane protein YdiY